MNSTILTITGSDGTGGSGLQADIRFINQLGGNVVSVVTSITVQNTLGIQEFYDIPANVVRKQLEAIINDIQPQVVKIGLIRRLDVAIVVADILREYQPRHIIYAPIMQSTHGDMLVEPKVFHSIEALISPLCTVVLDASRQAPDKLEHGHVNQLSSALAVYLSRGECVDDAMLHAKTYLQQLPSYYAEGFSRSSELYNQFLSTLERFFNRYDDVAFYADQLHVSHRYLGQVTRRIANRSPKSIIDERITKEIITLLTTTNKPLKSIAHELGFTSQADFSRFFRKQIGISPTQYKQLKHN